MSRWGATLAGLLVVCHTMIIPSMTKAATTGASIIKVRNSAPLSVVVARNFTFSSSILVSVSSARRSSISAIKLNHQKATSSWLVPLRVDTQKSRLLNVPVVVIRRYRSTAPLTETRSAVGAEA